MCPDFVIGVGKKLANGDLLNELDLGLRWISEGIGRLADGSESRFDVPEANIVWFGRTRNVKVFALGVAPIVGMSLLYGCELNMKVRPHGSVTIKKLRRRRGT
jgi:hypothetical protein